jgi:hypothetical protein
MAIGWSTMRDRSAIEWMDATWNRMRGCMKVSPGCKFFSIVTLAGTPRCWLRFTVGPAWTVNTEPFGHRAAVLDEQHGDDRLMVDCVAQDERQLARARRPADDPVARRGNYRRDADRLVERSRRPRQERAFQFTYLTQHPAHDDFGGSVTRIQIFECTAGTDGAITD